MDSIEIGRGKESRGEYLWRILSARVYLRAKKTETNMAEIKVKFRPSSVEGREGTVYYQVTHERMGRQITTDYHIYPSEWDDRSSTLVVRGNVGRQEILTALRLKIRTDMERLAWIAARLDNGGVPYTATDVIEEYRQYPVRCSLTNYMRRVIRCLKQNGKRRTSETYTSALTSFMKFRNDEDITLDLMSDEMMVAYEAWHHRRGNTPNTVSFYARILRAVYNRAVEEGLIRDRRPFRHVYTGVDKTIKRAIPLANVKELKRLDLSRTPELDFSRDMFMMSFYLRGMSFIDMAFLKKSDLRSGRLIYRRRKTGQLLYIEWTPEMQTILDKYPVNPTQYLLPIIRSTGINEWRAYRNKSYIINSHLKKVGGMIGVDMPLTMYVARHSWASAARTVGVPVNVISEGMGHGSENTTRIYLASLDVSVVDRANSAIINTL